jgi:hypothetical protein
VGGGFSRPVLQRFAAHPSNLEAFHERQQLCLYISIPAATIKRRSTCEGD